MSVDISPLVGVCVVVVQLKVIHADRRQPVALGELDYPERFP